MFFKNSKCLKALLTRAGIRYFFEKLNMNTRFLPRHHTRSICTERDMHGILSPAKNPLCACF